jgi:hypothetical protein
VAVPATSTIHHFSDGALCWRIVGIIGKGPNKGRGEHWSKTAKERDLWRTLMEVATRHGARQDAPTQCAVSIIEWPAKGGRRRDLDNVVASCKWMLDALVFRGYLANDSAKVVVHLGVDSPDLRNRPDWCGDHEGIEIRLEPR